MPIRVLIADDNDVFRKALRQLLAAVDGWEVLEAVDGQEAIDKSAANRPDVIILDLAMPAKDGFTAGREISALLPDTPILMCTMHMSAHVENEAQRSGIRKVISKSDSSLLVAAVQQLVQPDKPVTQTPVPQAISQSVLLSTTSSPSATPPATTEEAASDPAPPSLPKNVA